MAKVEVIKSNENTNKPNYVWVAFIGVFVVLGIIMLIFNITGSHNSEVNEYLASPLSDCSEFTLQEGIDRIDAVYNKNGIDFSYKVEKGTSVSGEELMYLKMYNMYGLYNTDVYVSLELIGGEVEIGDFVYKINGPALQNSQNIKALLCDW
ncbi:MAG: hypothetical protein IJY25_04595 [Bacilli bacterium]|nr:hypothetical protein [Bacilli bacterium]